MPHGIPDLVEHAYRSLNSSLYRQARSRFSSLSHQPNEKGRQKAVPFHLVGVTGFRTYRSGMPHGIPDLVEHAYRSLNSSLYRQARSRFSSLSHQPNEKGRQKAVPFHLVGVTGFRTYRSGMPHGIPDLVEHAYRSLNSSLYRQARSRFSSLSHQPNEKGRQKAVLFHLVGVTGFEPATSWTRSVR